MSEGPEIKELFEDIGTPFEILRDEGNISGEYLLYKTNAQVTKPFIREFFLETMLPYDSQVAGGDVLKVDDGTNRSFIVMNKTPENMEGEAFVNNVVLYKCNVSGELQRPSGEAPDPHTYRTLTQWETVKEECHGLLTAQLYGTDVKDEEDIGRINLEALYFYVPTKFGVMTNDRYSPVSGEYYKVDEIKRREFDGVDVCHLSEDTR